VFVNDFVHVDQVQSYYEQSWLSQEYKAYSFKMGKTALGTLLDNLGRRTTHMLSPNIHRAIRTNHVYRGFLFKKAEPLAPEFGVVKWETNNNE
jgi:hypothetical protein